MKKTLNNFIYNLDLSARYYKSLNDHHMAMYINQQLELLRDITERKKDYLAASYYVPSEILSLFDCNAVYIEKIAGLAAAFRIIKNPVEESKRQGMSPDRCSYQVMFHLLMEGGVIPKPDCFAALSYACNDAWMYCSETAKRSGVAYFHVDVPKIKGGSTPTQETYTYLAKQLEELYKQLKLRFPRKSGISEVIENANQTLYIKRKIDTVRHENPECADVTDIFKIFTLYNDLGKKSTTQTINQFLNKITAGYIQNDKHSARVLWLGIIPLYRNGIIKDIENKLECKVVGEEMFDFTEVELSYDTFFYDLADRIISTRFFTNESRLDAIFKSARVLGVNGIIHFSHRNCRFLPSLVPSIRKKAKEENIAFVEIQGDAIDPCFFNEAEMWRRLEGFNEKLYRDK